MSTDSVRPRAEVPLEEPQAALERALIDEYLRTHGYDPHVVQHGAGPQTIDLLRKAALYAAERLAEHEARSHYVHEIHGALPPTYKRSKP